MAQLLEQIESQKLRLLSIRENRTFPLQGHSTAIVSPAYCILNSEQVDAWSRLIQLEHEERCDLLKHFCDTQIKLLHFRDQLTQARCTHLDAALADSRWENTQLRQQLAARNEQLMKLIADRAYERLT